MRSFRRNKNGQFVIIAALIMAVFTLSMVSSISQVAQKRQEFKNEPVQENVLNLLSDFERCMTRALARATQTYNGDINAAESSVTFFVQAWVESATFSYQNIGLKINYVDASPSIEWGTESAFSSITAQFKIDVEAYGIKNLNIRTGKRVELKLVDCIKDGQQYNIFFYARETGKQDVFKLESITNLEQVNIKVLESNNIRDCTVTAMQYLGDSLWRVTFTLPTNVNWDKVSRINVKITTQEDIIVAGAISKQVSGTQENPKDMTWSNLYFVQDNKEYLIVPFYDYDQRAAHIAPTINIGYVKKQPSTTISFYSNKTPFDITLNDRVVLKLYVDATPAKSKKWLEISFGYTKPGGASVTIDATTFPNCGYSIITRGAFKTAKISNINSKWPWVVHFAVNPSQKEVPKGSTFWINITVYFEGEEGTVKIWMKATGQSNPSTIHLYS